MSKKDFSVALKYVEARPRSQRRKGAEARVSGISVGGSGISATDLSLLQANLISVTNNFTALKDLFDSMFEKDSAGNIHAKLSLWSSGGITAGGVGSGGSGGGGGISYNRLDSWSDYSADKAGYVLSALLGKDLDNRVSALANAGYITASYLAPYALRSEIPSLVGYATQSWVGDNYLSKRGGVITGQGDTRYVQLRLDGDIATIGFQQYGVDKGVVGWLENTGIRLQNLNGYGLAVKDSNEPIYYWGQNGSVQRTLLHSGNYADYITNSYIKSTLGISDWALASVKPTYTASEVGALEVNGTAQSSLKMAPEYLTDLNNATPWRFFDMRSGYGSTDGNKPNVAWVSGITGTAAGSSNYRWQLAMTTGSQNPYFRREHNGNWNNWSTLAFTSNIPTRLSQLTDDVVDGKYLPLSGGVITGQGDTRYVQLRLDGEMATVMLQQRGIEKGAVGWWSAIGVRLQNTNAYGLAVTDSNEPIYYWGQNGSVQRTLLHSGNYSSYALPITGGTVNGSITANSLTIGGVTLTYDSGNEALCINGNMYALGGITAGGAGISAYTSLEARVVRLEQQLNIS